MDIRQTFAGMKTVKISGKGVYLPGEFQGRVRFRPVQYKADGYKGRQVIWEYTLVTSNFDGKGHDVGSTRSTVVNLDKSQYAHADNTKITMALLGIDPNTDLEKHPEIKEEVWDTFCDFIEAAEAGKESLTDGLEAMLETQSYMTKGTAEKKSEPRTRYLWSPTPEAKAERAAALAEAA